MRNFLRHPTVVNPMVLPAQEQRTERKSIAVQKRPFIKLRRNTMATVRRPPEILILRERDLAIRRLRLSLVPLRSRVVFRSPSTFRQPYVNEYLMSSVPASAPVQIHILQPTRR